MTFVCSVLGWKDNKCSSPRALLVLVTSLIVGLSASRGSDRHPIRDTVYGKVQGVVHRLHDGRTVERYLGVPYASPPTGDKRFETPSPPRPWTDVRQADRVSTPCMQYTLDVKYIGSHNPDYNGDMTEDCLYLNVYVPVRNGSRASGLPVLVHIHGGSNEVGMGAMLHGDVLASYGGMVVVTFNYRLGAFGFLRVPQLGILGNFGLLDQVLALTWVQKNIVNFGGDPSKVTVQGHSAGSIDAAFHVLSPMSTGLFRYAILQSGAPTSYWAVLPEFSPEEMTKGALHHVNALGCQRQFKDESVDCLKRLNATTFSTTLYFHAEGFHYFSGAVDGRFLLDHPETTLAELSWEKNGSINAESVMLGIVKDEGSLTANEMMKTGFINCHDNLSKPFDENLLKTFPGVVLDTFRKVDGLEELTYFVYKPWADPDNCNANRDALSHLAGDLTFTAPTIQTADYLSALNDTEVYVYSFEHRSRKSIYPSWMGVPHGDDLFYLFGCPLEGHQLRNFTELDKRVSLALIDMWANFVTHGRPSITGENFSLPSYKEYKSYILISSNDSDVIISKSHHLRARFMAYWNTLLPYLQSRSRVTLEVPSREKILWIVVAVLVFLTVVTLAVIAFLCCRRRLQKWLLKQSNS